MEALNKKSNCYNCKSKSYCISCIGTEMMPKCIWWAYLVTNKEELMRADNNDEGGYLDAIDGDIYLNPAFGDLWIVDGTSFIKINDGYTIDLNEPDGFIKVGHVDGVTNKRISDTDI